jgi:hypothetical protein
VRWVSLLGVAAAAALLLTAPVGAQGRIRATLTSSLPASASPGDKVRIAWRLRDAAGRPVAVRHVFVRVVCPQGTDAATGYATRSAAGVYRAVVVVPPGGIGKVTIGTKGATFPITNLRRS